MAWKNEVSRLAKDFCLEDKVIGQIIAQTEAECKGKPPVRYGQRRAAWAYDVAQKKVMAQLKGGSWDV